MAITRRRFLEVLSIGVASFGAGLRLTEGLAAAADKKGSVYEQTAQRLAGGADLSAAPLVFEASLKNGVFDACLQASRFSHVPLQDLVSLAYLESRMGYYDLRDVAHIDDPTFITIVAQFGHECAAFIGTRKPHLGQVLREAAACCTYSSNTGRLKREDYSKKVLATREHPLISLVLSGKNLSVQVPKIEEAVGKEIGPVAYRLVHKKGTGGATGVARSRQRLQHSAMQYDRVRREMGKCMLTYAPEEAARFGVSLTEQRPLRPEVEAAFDAALNAKLRLF